MSNLLPNWIRAAPGAYLVGGCVRDLLIGRRPTDYDIAVLGNAPAHAYQLASTLGGRVVEIGKPASRVWRVVAVKGIIDVAPAVGGSLDEDLRRRDFTINALAIDTATGRVIDVTGGGSDLSSGTIRMVSVDAFRSDPIRLLRAFRFASQLSFTIDSQTRAAISRHANLINQSAGERIRDELFKLLVSEVAYPHVIDMQEAGLLQAIFLGLETSASESALPALEIILNGFALFPPDIAALLHAEFHEHRKACLKCAAILRLIDPPRQSAALSRLRLSKRDAARIEFLLRSWPLPREWDATTAIPAADELRWLRKAGDLAPDLLMQAVAAGFPKKQPTEAVADVLRMFRKFFFQFRPRTLAPPPVTGRDLIREFGLQPSRRFKQILDLIDEERLSRENLTRAEALELIRTHLDNSSKKILP